MTATSDLAELREELLRRRDADQAARAAVFAGEPGAMASVMRIDDENAVWLRSVIIQWGWPKRSFVGEEGAHAAWLLAQHADRDPGLQRNCLSLMQEAVTRGEVSPSDLAHLTDRVLLGSGEKQEYGTQLTTHEGRLAPCRLRDPGNVDERRASVGLESLGTYLNRALEVYGPPRPGSNDLPGLPCRS